MKRIISLILVLTLACCLLCACGGSDSEREKSAEEVIRSAVESRIIVNISLNYDTVGVPDITVYITENSDGSYRATGKVTVKDKYGDTYTGKYDAEVDYDEESNSAYVSDLDLGSLYKN